ncbi:MAG: hypothetical protein M3256_02035 [Actinomycetota bacterium]|nr:hypothetical protein [Actinomycetota bacterium]MDQ6945058.1 hypothetical protein [Actinomycetota bacterium]
MSKPAVVTWGTAAAGVRVEYVKGRRVLRLAPGHDVTDSVEVPLDEFCRGLGIDVAQLAPPQRYMLFAGVGNEPGGSSRHVVANFRDEETARQAFRALRLGHSQPADWAEVAVVEPSGGLRQLCWFGTPWGPGGRDSSGSTHKGPAGPPPGLVRASGPASWRARRRFGVRRPV